MKLIALIRRAATLERIEASARDRVAVLKAEVDSDPDASSRHRQAARRRAEKTERASLTDPEARAMRFADGATRLGYNVQLAAATGTDGRSNRTPLRCRAHTGTGRHHLRHP